MIEHSDSSISVQVKDSTIDIFQGEAPSISNKAGEIVVVGAFRQPWFIRRLATLGLRPSLVFGEDHSCDLLDVCKSLEAVVGFRGVARVLRDTVGIVPRIANGHSDEVGHDIDVMMGTYEEMIRREKIGRFRTRELARIPQIA